MSLIQVLDLKTKRDNEKETVYFLWTMSYQFLSQNNYIYEDYEWMLQHLDAICCSVVWTTIGNIQFKGTGYQTADIDIT